MLKQQHCTLTNVKKVKSQSTTPLSFWQRITTQRSYDCKHQNYFIKVNVKGRTLLFKTLGLVRFFFEEVYAHQDSIHLIKTFQFFFIEF